MTAPLSLNPVNWQPRLRALLFSQFRTLPPKDFSVTPPRSNIEALADYIAQEAQKLEDALQGMLSILQIDESSGVQLANLGRLVGQPSTGEPDDVYRLRIKARIVANRSSGDPESLYAVFVAMFALQGQGGQAKTFTSPAAIGEFVFRVLGFPLDPSTAGVLFELLASSTVGGVRLILEWPSTNPAGAFQCSDASAPSVSYGSGFGDATLIPSGGQLAGALSS